MAIQRAALVLMHPVLSQESAFKKSIKDLYYKNDDNGALGKNSQVLANATTVLGGIEFIKNTIIDGSTQ
jgi:hypothetical protein